MWPASPNFALFKNAVMIDFLFKFFTMVEAPSIYTSLRNAVNTWTDRTITGGFRYAAQIIKEKTSQCCTGPNILYTYHTVFSRTRNLKLQ